MKFSIKDFFSKCEISMLSAFTLILLKFQWVATGSVTCEILVFLTIQKGMNIVLNLVLIKK